MHKTLGQRDPALAFPLANTRDDADERRQANRAIAVSAIGLAVTGLAELLGATSTIPIVPDWPGQARGFAAANWGRTRLPYFAKDRRLPGDYPGGMHKIQGQRDPAFAFPLAGHAR